MNEAKLDSIHRMVEQLVGNVASLRAEFVDFKNEMREFKHEMCQFKDEMYHFKDEMLAFKDDTTQRLSDIESEQKGIRKELANIDHRLDFQLTRLSKTEEEIHLLKIGEP